MPSTRSVETDSARDPDRARLEALAVYRILDTPAEAEFDDLVHLAQEICRTEVALITLLDADRQWFKARIGTEASETPIDQALCVHALAGPDCLVIPDLSLDPRTKTNALVTGEPFVRFYAGARLVTPDGAALGTLCVLDTEPRPEGLTEKQEDALRRLARQAMSQLELRRVIGALDDARRHAQEADRHHRQIVDSAIDYGIITMDLGGDVTSWNSGAENILGWGEAEMRGRPAEAFFTPEDVAAGIPSAEMRAARQRGRGLDDRWHMRKDGGRFFARGEMMPLTSAGGDHVGYLKILRDMTHQRRIDERLRLADERLQVALAASGVVGLWDWMVDTDLLHGDANFARLYGLDEHRTAGGLTMEEYQEFIVAEDLPELRERIRNTFEHGDLFLVEYRLAIPGEPLRWVECRGRMLYNEEGRAERFSGSAVDITERKRAEAESRRLAAIVEQSGDFIGVARLDGSVAWVNEAGRQLVGLDDPESAVRTSIEDYFPPEQWPEIAATVFPAVQETGNWRGELSFRHFGTGELIPVIYDAIALRDEAGAVTAYATVTRDIREQKRAEATQHLLNQELSHRMKNTLAMVQAIATQTLRGVADTEAVAAFKQRVHAIASAHEVLLKQHWSAAGVENVAEAVLGVFELNDRFDLSGPSVELGARATLSLSLLLHELATNATKHGALSSETGRVAIEWRVEDPAEEGGSPEIVLDWSERGGPPPRPPEGQGRGFGSRLVKLGLIGTGGSDLRYLPEGLQATFRAPLDQLQQS